MKTNMTGFRWFSEMFASLCFESKASASEGLSINGLVKALHRYTFGYCKCLVWYVGTCKVRTRGAFII